MNTDILQKKIRVRGRVQGVGYRYSAVRMAEHLGLKGYAKNLYNGDVELEIEGNKLAIEQMIHWCHVGPGTARVDSVYIKEGTVRGYSSFGIKY